jgi:hypothetical protein
MQIKRVECGDMGDRGVKKIDGHHDLDLDGWRLKRIVGNLLW